jgi:hypothetical protein
VCAAPTIWVGNQVLWLRSDHDSAAVKPKPEPLVPTSAAVVAEFA